MCTYPNTKYSVNQLISPIKECEYEKNMKKMPFKCCTYLLTKHHTNNHGSTNDFHRLIDAQIAHQNCKRLWIVCVKIFTLYRPSYLYVICYVNCNETCAWTSFCISKSLLQIDWVMLRVNTNEETGIAYLYYICPINFCNSGLVDSSLTTDRNEKVDSWHTTDVKFIE